MDVALVVGSARGVWEDLRAAAALLLERPTVMAVNAMVAFLPRIIHHAISHHGSQLAHLLGYRRLEIGLDLALRDAPVITHSSYATAGVDHAWPQFTAGDSSLLATRVACALGFSRVLLAGVPLDASGHFYDDPEGPVLDKGAIHRSAWLEAQGEFEGRVRSLSGWTAELLGKP